jgi:hypothetical protein
MQTLNPKLEKLQTFKTKKIQIRKTKTKEEIEKLIKYKD